MSPSTPSIEIRAAEAADEPRWRELWRDYLAFYRQSLAPGVTDLTWARILDPSSPLFARVALHQGACVGFAVGVLHEGSWTTTPVCYLEDLFVAPEIRGSGVGRALINDLEALARAEGWSRLYWHTDADNEVARLLYDRFVAADPVVRYRLALT